jgi:hypothetical protein
MDEFYDDLHVRGEPVSDKDKAVLLDQFSSIALKNGKDSVVGEIEKTPEDIKMIDILNGQTNSLIEQYGGKGRNIPIDNVHIFDIEIANQVSSVPVLSGSSTLNKVDINVMYSKSQVFKFAMMAHEVIHTKSYRAIEIERGGGILDVNTGFRGGLVMKSKKRGDNFLFRIFDEALTEEGAVKLLADAFKMHPDLFSKDVELASRHGLSVETDFIAKGKTSVLETIDGESVGYMAVYEREKKLFSSFKSKFAKKMATENSLPEGFAIELVEKLFYEAKFAGKLASLGLEVDRVFGGGTFTKLAKVSDGLVVKTDPSPESEKIRQIECGRMEELIELL